MAENPLPEDKNGVIIGPLYKGKNVDQMAMNIFKLMMALGLRCSEISRVMINPTAGYARIEVPSLAIEDYLMKMLKEVKSVMSRYDVRQLMEDPECLLAVRIRQEISDGGTSTNRPTTGENVPESTHSEQPEATASDKRDKTAENKSAANVEINSLSKNSEILSSLNIEFEQLIEEEESKIILHEATSTSDIPPIEKPKPADAGSSAGSAQKPIMISAKTSTPIVYPCGCPETVFYHRYQQIGTETRYSEFKRGGLIQDQRGFRAQVAKYVCGFLNSEGGTLYFGVDDDGIVLGIMVDRVIQEILQSDIDFAIRRIEPNVDKCEYSVNYARIKKENGQFSADLKVLEVCVKPRKPSLSSYSYNGVIYIRRDGSLQALP